MDTRLDQRRSLVFKAFSILAITLLCISILSRTVLADMGPKRSVLIDIKNPPSEPYYIALLMKGTLPSDPENFYRYVHILDEDENIKDIFFNYDEDGYVLFSYAGSTCSVVYSEDMWIEDHVEYNYMVPSTFKVIVVTRSGEVSVSDEITAQAFHAEFEYDYSENILKEVKIVSKYSKNLTIESLVFCVFTLITEGIVLLCFGLFRKKNILRFLVANIITQALLYGFNLTSRFISPIWQNYYFFWLGVEALITVIELFIYRKKLVKKDGTVSVKKNIFYAILANFISAFIDIPIIFIATTLK